MNEQDFQSSEFGPKRLSTLRDILATPLFRHRKLVLWTFLSLLRGNHSRCHFASEGLPSRNGNTGQSNKTAWTTLSRQGETTRLRIPKTSQRKS